MAHRYAPTVPDGIEKDSGTGMGTVDSHSPPPLRKAAKGEGKRGVVDNKDGYVNKMADKEEIYKNLWNSISEAQVNFMATLFYSSSRRGLFYLHFTFLWLVKRH
jgi:hypothetical protein